MDDAETDASRAALFGCAGPGHDGGALQRWAAGAAMRLSPGATLDTLRRLGEREVAAASSYAGARDAPFAWKHPLAGPALIASLERPIVRPYEGPGGGPLWRQPSAASHEVYTECRRLELLGDPSVVPLLRATLAKVPAHAKGSKRCIKMCIDALSPEPPMGEREPVEPLEYGARTRPSKGR